MYLFLLTMQNSQRHFCIDRGGYNCKTCVLRETDLYDVMTAVCLLEQNCDEYDRNLLRCIVCAVANNWSLVFNGVGLRKFVVNNSSRLPMCNTYLLHYKYSIFEMFMLQFVCFCKC